MSKQPTLGIVYVPIGIGTPATPINTNQQQFYVYVQLGYFNGNTAPSTTVTLTPYQYDPVTGSLVKPDPNVLATNTPQSYTFSGQPSSSVPFSLTTGPQAQNSKQQIVLIASCNGYTVSNSLPIGYSALPQPVGAGARRAASEEEIEVVVEELREASAKPKSSSNPTA
ncbi:MAG TPA: hypothetical protein VKV18_13330 [Chthonomonas sp.]|uniref:hypothetical protein n=1 Tax=Chthonomonas sp. TaxID=2282153 RepID=UPI002B4AD757|nr:hypothetical protein [Chthonomonas sp.]HLI49653.1 hypothetical protein [Chthonomonas sp.]